MQPILNPAGLAFIFSENSIINPNNLALLPDSLALLIPIFGTIGFFTFLVFATWTQAQRREKDAFYKHETLKRISESPDGGAAAMEMLREEQRMKDRRRREGRKIGGLVNFTLGIVLTVFLFAIRASFASYPMLYLVGLVPLAVGAALLAYSYWLAPKEADAHSQQ